MSVDCVDVRELLELAQEFQNVTDRINETFHDLQQDIRELDRLKADIYRIAFYGDNDKDRQ